jgi:hypothetical protein
MEKRKRRSFTEAYKAEVACRASATSLRQTGRRLPETEDSPSTPFGNSSR